MNKCVIFVLFILLSCIVFAASEVKEEAVVSDDASASGLLNSFGVMDLVDMKYIYEIWEPEIAEVAQVMFEQLKKTNKKVELLHVDKDNAQVANGVYYRVKIELDKGQQIEFSMLDFGRPHYMWIESNDPDLNVLSELKPVFPRMEFKGPLELHLPASREVNMKVPRTVDTGSLKKIILDKNAAVNASGFIEISLHQPVTLNKLALVNGITDPNALQQLAGLDIFGQVQNKPTHKLVLSTRNTPHLQLSNEHDVQNRIKNFIDGARKHTPVEYGSLNFDDNDLHIESETALKVRRKSHDEVILTEKDSKKASEASDSPQSSLIELEIPINDEVYRNLEELFKQIKMSYPAASIKRVLEGQAEAVKCFLIPMQVVDGESEAQWYVMAMRRVTGENVLLNVHKHNVMPKITMNEAVAHNETMEVVNEQIKQLVRLQAEDIAEQQKQLPNDEKVTRVTPEGVVEDKKNKAKN